MPSKDKNGIELQPGDYVKIVVPVMSVGEGEVGLCVAGARIHVKSKDTEAVVYNESVPAGTGVAA